MLPVSNDTLLRVVRRRTAPRVDPLTFVGVDDWAFRRNRRYGTIVCDLERRRIVTLLPDREVATVRAWLADHPGIKIVSQIAAAVMARRPPRRCRTPSKSLIAGI
jgi:transposase